MRSTMNDSEPWLSALAQTLPRAELDLIHSGMFTASLPGVLTAVTLPLAEMLKRTPRELCGMAFHKLLSATSATIFQKALQRLSDGYDEGLPLRLTVLPDDGEVLHVDLYLSLMICAQGTPVLQGLMIDRTRHFTQEKLDTLARERVAKLGHLIGLGEMASSIANELNQPLTAITALAQTCVVMIEQHKLSDPSLLLPYCQRMVEQAMRAGSAIRRTKDVLTQNILSRELITPLSLVKSVLRIVQPELRAAGVRIENHMPADLPKINVDLIHLQGAMINLIRNAIDAMAERPAERRVLTIFGHQAGHRVSFSFDDCGKGVSDERLGSLFAPFFTTKPQGTGLGLSTSQRVVQAHGGSLDYEVNPSGGARFILTLPDTEAVPV